MFSFSVLDVGFKLSKFGDAFVWTEGLIRYCLCCSMLLVHVLFSLECALVIMICFIFQAYNENRASNLMFRALGLGMRLEV